MPLYEYECENCSKPFSERRPIEKRDVALVCPNCSGTRVVRRVSSFAAFSRGEGNAASSLSSSSCGGCSATSCAGCGVSHSH